MKFFEYQLKVERLCLNAGVLIVFRCSSVSTCLQQNKEKGPAQHAISEYCENYREISLTPLRLRPYQLQHTAGGGGGGTPDTERTFVCPSQRSANKDESASWMIFLSAALQLLHWKLVCRQIEGTSNSGRWRNQKPSSRIVIVVYCIRILTSGLLAKHISLGTQHIVSCYPNKCWRDTRWLSPLWTWPPPRCRACRCWWGPPAALWWSRPCGGWRVRWHVARGRGSPVEGAGHRVGPARVVTRPVARARETHVAGAHVVWVGHAEVVVEPKMIIKVPLYKVIM